MAEEEQLVLPKRRRNKDDGELDVTAMIDVTFLLLAFFVVVSKMDPQAAVDLPVASYGASIQDKSAVTLIVVVDKDDSEKVAIFKGPSMGKETQISNADPESQQDEIAAYVENELSTHPTKDAVLIKGGGKVKHGMIEMVKRGVSQSELAQSRKIYVGIEEEQ